MSPQTQQDIIDDIMENAFSQLHENIKVTRKTLNLFINALRLEAQEIEDSIGEILDTVNDCDQSDMRDAINAILRGAHE